MRRSSVGRTFVAAFALVALWAAPAQAQQAVKMEWLSWSIFRFTSPAGKVVMTNPFLSNPDSKTKVEDIKKVDVIVVADGHADEVGQTIELAKAHPNVKVLATSELSNGYLAAKGVQRGQTLGFPGIGDVFPFDGVSIRLMNSLHGSAVPDPTQPYGGNAVGYMIKFENGLTVYFAGSTGITLDMQLWGMLYKPDVVILPLSGRRDPMDFAHMVRLLSFENPNLKTVIPHHHRVKDQPGQAAPKDAEAAIKSLNLRVTFLNPELGKEYTFTK